MSLDGDPEIAVVRNQELLLWKKNQKNKKNKKLLYKVAPSLEKKLRAGLEARNSYNLCKLYCLTWRLYECHCWHKYCQTFFWCCIVLGSPRWIWTFVLQERVGQVWVDEFHQCKGRANAVDTGFYSRWRWSWKKIQASLCTMTLIWVVLLAALRVPMYLRTTLLCSYVPVAIYFWEFLYSPLRGRHVLLEAPRLERRYLSPTCIYF